MTRRQSPERFVPATALATLAGCLATLLLLAAPAAAQQCPSVVWADEFDGTALDLSRWEPQIGDGCDIGLCGWGNNELQWYLAENATVSGGLLSITAKEQRVRSRNYTSARLRTLGMGDFTHGRFEARIRMTEGQGIWPAFWMLPTDEVFGGWPASGEIDIMENVGHETDRVHGTVHYGSSPQDHQLMGSSFSLHSGKFADDFHVFAIEREPGVIRWMVDDVLYQTITESDISPANWPFEERFHFLLNVAVGGNWPGNPDETTVFPQVLSVDWVRVWDTSFPHVTGDRQVANQEAGVPYSVGNAVSGSTFSWSVPSGATIVSGQGTSSIVVDWGTTGGPVTVDVSSGCGTRQLAIDVAVDPVYVKDFSFENFDEPAEAVLTFASGTLTEVANPAPDAVNSSALSGRYERSSADVFDVIAWSTGLVPDASEYETGHRRLSLDVLTDAPVGTEVLLQLEDADLTTPDNYPTGRHSRYQAFTTKQGSWDRLEVRYLDSPDPDTLDTEVDSLIILFAPNTLTGDVYTFDNLDGLVVEGGETGGGGGGTDPTAVHVGSIVAATEGVGQGNKRGLATVTVVDDLGNPTGGADVTVTFTGSFSETVTGTTATDGTVELRTSGTVKGGVSFTVCVDDVAHPSLVYDASANVATCDSV